MTTLAEKIAIMQAFERGEKIEYTKIGQNYWSKSIAPIWDWSELEYRIAKEPKKCYAACYRQPNGVYNWVEAGSKMFDEMSKVGNTRIPELDKEGTLS